MSETEVYEWRDDDGDLLGYLTPDEDGDLALLDADSGEVIAYYDGETGEQLATAEDADADEAGYDESDGYDDGDPYAIADRLEQLEQRMDEPRQVEYVQADDGPDPDTALELETDRIEAAADRPLTLAERRAIWREGMADQIAGRQTDAADIVERLDELGEPLVNIDSGNRAQDHVARTEWMAQRLADNERIANAAYNDDDLTADGPPASRADYDLDDGPQRREWMTEALRGAAGPEDTFSSSDYEE